MGSETSSNIALQQRQIQGIEKTITWYEEQITRLDPEKNVKQREQITRAIEDLKEQLQSPQRALDRLKLIGITIAGLCLFGFIIIAWMRNYNLIAQFVAGLAFGRLLDLVYDVKFDHWLDTYSLRLKYLEHYHWGVLCFLLVQPALWGFGLSLVLDEFTSKHMFAWQKPHFTQSLIIGVIVVVILIVRWTLIPVYLL